MKAVPLELLMRFIVGILRKNDHSDDKVAHYIVTAADRIAAAKMAQEIHLYNSGYVHNPNLFHVLFVLEWPTRYEINFLKGEEKREWNTPP